MFRIVALAGAVVVALAHPVHAQQAEAEALFNATNVVVPKREDRLAIAEAGKAFWLAVMEPASALRGSSPVFNLYQFAAQCHEKLSKLSASLPQSPMDELIEWARAHDCLSEGEAMYWAADAGHQPDWAPLLNLAAVGVQYYVYSRLREEYLDEMYQRMLK
jgi:hypothetical protein